MTYKYDVMIGLGGTNIEERMNLAMYGYHNSETPVVMFVGASQGKDAVKYFRKNGIPCYSEETGKGYIVAKDDKSKTTLESAAYARTLADQFNLGKNICICTEHYHEEGALEDFKNLFPESNFNLYSESTRVIENPLERFIRYRVHEPIRELFNILYLDLPEAITESDINKIRSRDILLQKAVYNPLRDKVESPLLELIERFKQTKLFRLIKKLKSR